MRYFRKGYNNTLIDVINIEDKNVDNFIKSIEQQGYIYNPLHDKWVKDLFVIREVKQH